MNQNFLKIQNQIRENSENLQEYVKDLYDWEDQIGVKTTAGASASKSSEPVLPPIRNAEFKAELRQLKQSSIFNEKDVKQSSQPTEGYQRDVTPMPQYYKNWDRFDVDSELKKLDNEDTKKVDDDIPRTKEDFLKRTKGAKPGTKIVIKGGRMKASSLEDLKSAGNSYFTSLEYEQAINSYSEAI